MKWVFLIILMTASASAASAANDPTVDALVAQFAPLVQTLDRPVTVDHYVPREGALLPTSGLVTWKDPAAQTYLSMMLAYFWNPGQPIDKTPAAGLYAAVDPVISREFGKQNWALFEFEMPQGVRFLNIQAPVQVAIGADGSDEVATSPADGSCHSAPELFFIRADQRCRELGLAVLKRLGVSAILYDYATAEFQECGHYRPGSAFILIGRESFDPARSALLVQEMPAPPAVDPLREERQRINSLLAKAGATHLPSAIHYGPAHYAPMWNVGEAVDPATLDAWMQDHLLGCGAHPEDGAGLPFPGTI